MCGCPGGSTGRVLGLWGGGKTRNREMRNENEEMAPL